jgi:beta-lactamase class A
LREFEEGGWISIHPENNYHPGSLLKLGALFNILKQAESDTALFSKKLTFQKTKERIPTQTYSSQSLVEGESYSVATLLDYMIAYSDNYATSLLHSVMNYRQYLQTFSQLNLPEPNGSDPEYSVTAANFSNFFKVLYNGTFLSPMMSEKAIEILMKCDFNQGMEAGLPQGTKIAHKFGEWGNREGRHELHEMGIIYLGSKPYLLTIMTAGKEVEKLKPTLSILTHQTHHFLRKLSRQGI